MIMINLIWKTAANAKVEELEKNRAGLKNCDIDFINLNVDSIQLMDVIKEKKQIDLGMMD